MAEGLKPEQIELLGKMAGNKVNQLPDDLTPEEDAAAKERTVMELGMTAALLNQVNGIPENDDTV